LYYWRCCKPNSTISSLSDRIDFMRMDIESDMQHLLDKPHSRTSYTTGNISQQGSTITIKCPQDVKTVYKDCNKVQIGNGKRLEVKPFQKTFDNDDSRTEKEQLDIAIDEAIEFNKELCWTIADIIDDSSCPNPAVVEVPAANEPAANVISAARVSVGLMENDNRNDDGQSRRKRNIGNIQQNSKVHKKKTKKAKTPSHDEDEDNHGRDDGEECQSKYDSSGIDEEEEDQGGDDDEESQSKYDSSSIDEEEDDSKDDSDIEDERSS